LVGIGKRQIGWGKNAFLPPQNYFSGSAPASKSRRSGFNHSSRGMFLPPFSVCVGFWGGPSFQYSCILYQRHRSPHACLVSSSSSRSCHVSSGRRPGQLCPTLADRRISNFNKDDYNRSLWCSAPILALNQRVRCSEIRLSAVGGQSWSADDSLSARPVKARDCSHTVILSAPEAPKKGLPVYH